MHVRWKFKYISLTSSAKLKQPKIIKLKVHRRTSLARSKVNIPFTFAKCSVPLYWKKFKRTVWNHHTIYQIMLVWISRWSFRCETAVVVSGPQWQATASWGYKVEINRCFREQGWHSGESTPLPPMWLGFDSRSLRHTWVEFVVLVLVPAPRVFLRVLRSLQNRRYLFAFFRRGRASARRARSARHTRREGREKNNACTLTIVHAIPPPDTPSNHQPITAFDRSGVKRPVMFREPRTERQKNCRIILSNLWRNPKTGGK